MGSAIIRAITSDVPPGTNGTIIVIGRVGESAPRRSATQPAAQRHPLSDAEIDAVESS
jgi:hypothetical protein